MKDLLTRVEASGTVTTVDCSAAGFAFDFSLSQPSNPVIRMTDTRAIPYIKFVFFIGKSPLDSPIESENDNYF